MDGGAGVYVCVSGVGLVLHSGVLPGDLEALVHELHDLEASLGWRDVHGLEAGSEFLS